MQYENDRIYIGEGLLPEPPNSVVCLLVCVGIAHTPIGWHAGQCEVFAIPDSDITAVFNRMQDTFLKWSVWNSQLFHILDTTADLQEMMDLSAVLFEKAICFVDHRLEFMCGSRSDSLESFDFGTDLSVTEVKDWSAKHKWNTSMREPFCYEYKGITDYCINIYLNGTYCGIVTMAPTYDAEEGNLRILFQHFVMVFSRALCKQRNHNNKFLDLRSVFESILMHMPVNQALLHRELEHISVKKWRCLVIKPHGKMAELPLEYFCRQLEQQFAAGYALTFESQIVIFLPVRDQPTPNILPRLRDKLNDFDVRCGVSQFFTLPQEACTYYAQARTALEFASRLKPDEKIAYFEEYALEYALKNSVGEFKPQDLWPEGLRRIRSGEPREDSWNILKTYLDLEMNVTQTARVLYMHRTTLQTHLKRIEELVDLSTPKKRMYVRYCIYQAELYDRL